MYAHLSQTHHSSDTDIRHLAPQLPAALQLEPNADYTEAMRCVVYWNRALKIVNWLGLLLSLVCLFWEVEVLGWKFCSYVPVSFIVVSILTCGIGLSTAEKTDVHSARCYVSWVSIYSGIIVLVFTVIIAVLADVLESKGEPRDESESNTRTAFIVMLILAIAALLVTCGISFVFILVACKAYNARKALELVTSRPQYSNQVVVYPHYVQGVPMGQLAI